LSPAIAALAGSALWRELERQGFKRLLGKTRRELDLLDAAAVQKFFADEKPDYVFIAAAKVGGISCQPKSARRISFGESPHSKQPHRKCAAVGVRKLLFLGSSCIYPKLAPQPLKEEIPPDRPAGADQQWYAIAKIAGSGSARPAAASTAPISSASCRPNLYGTNDHIDLQTSHVLPALIRKFHEAKISGAPSVTCWGTGAPLREFLHADDLAAACVFLMRHYSEEQFINIGYGSDLSILELAQRVRRVIGFQGEIVWDHSKPDGTPRKLLDSSRIFALGWRPKIDLDAGLAALTRIS